jgi:hypothetical protein
LFWSRSASGVGSGDAELRPATGVAGGFERLGHGQEQKPHHVGDGGVVFDRKAPGLAVKLRIDGYGDVPYVSHGGSRDQRSEVRDQRSGTLGDLDICSVRRRWVILRKTQGQFFRRPIEGSRRCDKSAAEKYLTRSLHIRLLAAFIMVSGR